jgi:fumarylpyruvate hydrolase
MTENGAYVFPPLKRPSLPVRGTDKLFPVHRIYCVGRNYAEHAIEMGHDPDREPPFFFQKNPDNLVTDGKFPYPDKTSDVHYEFEMVVALAKGGRDIAVDRALDHVYGYAAGLDMTRRDLQAEAKKLGRPWDVGKAFERSAPCSQIVPASAIGHPSKGAVRLSVNGAVKQQGDLAQMIWKVPEMIAILSGLFELRPGDLIFSGTPAGVGPVKRGDVLEGSIEEVASLKVTIV